MDYTPEVTHRIGEMYPELLPDPAIPTIFLLGYDIEHALSSFFDPVCFRFACGTAFRCNCSCSCFCCCCWLWLLLLLLFPTRQGRVLRFYVSLLLPPSFSFLLRSPRCQIQNCEPPSPVCQPRASATSVPCRTSTASLCDQCSLPDLNREHLRGVFPAGPQPRPYALSVPCQTSTAR